MVPVKNFESIINDTVMAIDGSTINFSAQEVYPASSVNDQNSIRTARSNTAGLLALLSRVDVTALGQALLLTALLMLAFKLVFLMATPGYFRRKRFSETPGLAEVLSASWDDPDHRSPFPR